MGSTDTEITAMSSLVQALEPLDEPARHRVLRWAAERFDVALSVQKHRRNKAEEEAPEDEVESTGDPNGNGFDDFAELFAAASPATEADRALVGGYWFQVIKGQTEVESFQINKELKNLGHGIGTVNRAFDYLIKKKPQLALQVKKSGKSQQARKKYRITTAGIQRVKDLIDQNGN